MKRAGWRKRSRKRLEAPPTATEAAAAGLMAGFLLRALGLEAAPAPLPPAEPRVTRDLGKAEVVE